MKSRETLGIVYDQIGSPTYAQDLALAIKTIIENGRNLGNQIYHYGNLGVASWYDLTIEINNHLKTNCIIFPIESHDYPTPAKRPNYSVFNTKKIQETFNIRIPHWKESLSKCLEKLS